MTHVLDTDHLSLLLKQDGAEWATITAHISACGQENVGVCVVSFHEQFLGCHAKLNAARRPDDLVRWYRKMAEVIEVYSSLSLVAFDEAAAKELAALPGNLRIGTMDLRIAATALARGLTVVTRNDRDFAQVPGLKVEDWTR